MDKSHIIAVLTFVLPFAYFYSESFALNSLVFPLFFAIIWNSYGITHFSYPVDAISSHAWIVNMLLLAAPYVILCLVSAQYVYEVRFHQMDSRKGVVRVAAGIILLVVYYLIFWALSALFVSTYHGAIGPVPIPLTPILALLLLIHYLDKHSRLREMGVE